MWSGGNENAKHKPAMLDRMVTVVRKLPAALVMSIAMSASQSPAGDNAVSNAIEAKVTDIARGSLQSIGGIPLSGASFIVDLYGARSYEPAWVGDDADQELQVELTDALREGFTAADFHADLIAKLRDRAISGDPEALADLDIAETEVAARLLHHIYYGKVDPTTLDAAWNFDRAFAPGKAAEMVNQYLNVAGIGALVDDIGLRHPAYLLMQDALAKYRQIELEGGWPEIPFGDVLKPEAQDERVSVLRRRLSDVSAYGSK